MKRIVLDTEDLTKLVCLGTALDDDAEEYHKFEYNRIILITYDAKFVQAVEDNQIEYVQLDIRGIIAQIRHYVCKRIKLIRARRKRIRLHLYRKVSIKDTSDRKEAYVGASILLNPVRL